AVPDPGRDSSRRVGGAQDVRGLRVLGEEAATMDRGQRLEYLIDEPQSLAHVRALDDLHEAPGVRECEGHVGSTIGEAALVVGGNHPWVDELGGECDLARE